MRLDVCLSLTLLGECISFDDWHSPPALSLSHRHSQYRQRVMPTSVSQITSAMGTGRCHRNTS